ncbi:tryptophan synthase, alpha subunit [Hydrogenobacter thermophilus TK-6]|uniref:Tryptophan synthase alpha chain n=1 Tax=Hydrogenobacter thermophilus (strain DSM 6534 / IAM 12695 / TK-6) TaxID=608538 RepID=D3DJZ8_HYDTT|nr:tryptophan synthase subunit alpha [Hydrogenobacter thermophilus]ADO46071.1 tryptophan synthase, alpha subunit [Hydrogenobacter thermophilus TK-6]BAI70150.1 tryptophan synthase alpha chain [Hydrogenobacter thermophilus TK-6]
MGRERLQRKLETLKDSGEKALVCYLMAGYPDYETSLQAFRVVLKSGADILEIGYPFSDPVADGPTIQMAHEEALRIGIKLKDVLRISSTLREEFPEVPFILMTYYNPVFKVGLERFCSLAQESDIDGLIVPDLPAEESADLKKYTQKYGLSLILLASPTSSEKRLRLICEHTDDLTYLVSITGTTGEREELPLEGLKRNINTYRGICQKPVVIGFGISKGEQARAIGDLSDGVVVGSALVKLAGERKLEELSKKVRELKSSLKFCPKV